MKKRKYFFFLFLPALLLFPAVLFLCQNIDSILFHRITEQYFIQSLENDALNLHYTLAYPEAYGIQLKEVSLPVYSETAQQQSFTAAEAFYEKLSHICPEKLSDEDRYTYSLLSSYISTELESSAFSYYEEPFSPSSGMHTELPLLFAEYVFREKKDIENYLDLLSSVPAYLNGLILYESKKAEAGLFMPETDAFSVAQQCDSLLSETALSDGTHFLQTTFSDRLTSLLADRKITQQEQTQFLTENDRILTTIVLPAYQKTGDSLIALSEKSTSPGGLCQTPEGKAYYAWLVKRATGCSMDPDSLYTLLQTQFRQKYDSLQTLAAQYRTVTGDSPDFSLLTQDFPLTDPSDILSDLQNRMMQDFPSLSSLTEQKVNCTIKDVDPALEAFTSPAFYMTPPIDDLWHNTICINRASTATGVELYTTLAHEGYPGHLYQTVYSSLSASSDSVCPVRELLYYGGYTEGWAYYVERLSYDYAGKLAASASPEAAALLCEIAAVQRDLQVNLFCLLDISLHYQGADKDDMLQSLSSLGIEGDTAEHIYDYLRTSPTAYLKYYVGYLEILALRKKAADLWGEDFSLLGFHRFLLEAGPSDFSNLLKRLEETCTAGYTAKTASAKPTLSATHPSYFPDILCPTVKSSTS